jgi:hypothetical protein
LTRIKSNIDNQAKHEVEKLHRMMLKEVKREKQAKESKEFAVEDAKARREKYDLRRQMVRDARIRELKEREAKGMKEYQTYIKEVALRKAD